MITSCTYSTAPSTTHTLTKPNYSLDVIVSSATNASPSLVARTQLPHHFEVIPKLPAEPSKRKIDQVEINIEPERIVRPRKQSPSPPSLTSPEKKNTKDPQSILQQPERIRLISLSRPLTEAALRLLDDVYKVFPKGLDNDERFEGSSDDGTILGSSREPQLSCIPYISEEGIGLSTLLGG